MKQKISFIIPVLNEEKIIVNQLIEFIRFLKKNKLSKYEILPVENGSTDNTWRILELISKKTKIIRPLRIVGSSYGRAAQHGLLCANGEKIFIMDIDFLNKKFVKEAIDKLNYYQIVIGSKNHPKSIDSRPLPDQLRTKVFNKILRSFFNFKGTDTHGIRSFQNSDILKETLRECYCKYELLDTELLMRLLRKKCSYFEIPVSIKEIRPTKYTSYRRLKLVIIDLYRLITFKILKSEKKTLQINADDFGFSPIVSKAIIDQYKNKSIDIISVLSNLISKNEILLLKKNVINSDISIHINLVRGKPLSKKTNIKSLINKNGEFYSLPEFSLRLFLGLINKNDIILEINKQLNNLKNNGIHPHYIDSEQHTHLLPPIAKIVDDIAMNENLKVRSKLSSQLYLMQRIPKLTILNFLQFITNQKNYLKSKSYDAKIVHPGNNFD